MSVCRVCRICKLSDNSHAIEAAADYCRAAVENKAHVVLMNAEVDLAHGPELAALAAQKGLVLTSDAGDLPPETA